MSQELALPLPSKKANKLTLGQRREQRSAWLLTLPAVLLMMLFLIGPIIAIIALSFTDWQLGMTSFAWVGIDNYVQLINDDTFWKALKNTLLYVGIVLPFSVIGGLAIAILIEARPSGKSLYRTAFFLPVMGTLIAMSIVWEYILQPDFGLLNMLLNQLGINGNNWLNDKDTVIYVLAGIGIWHQLGYNMVLFMSGLMAIPKHLYEAAEMDGVPNGWSRFKLITWPMLGPVTLFVMVISAIKAFQVFDTVEVLTQGGPSKNSEVLLHLMYVEGFQFFRTSYAAAITVIFLFIVLMITVVKMRFMEKKVHY
ncbi:carbohydrate ABC transporter permease [Vibrio coralliirubri]|uniref:carbohydrate ABC transporter permease n=1 Tax=Vibrio coralliirubri TaxID=1516159 RepID=UPI000630761D|nr:sugar ABC transporter permease [Vibrio coralliirubri]CDT09232.1 Binding-protein-dependent transport systems inner membrane component [Vibrio coralliirubri]CDT77437.1 Binding-protein-dependent transport systems inner membrane component [Vibrio coralliirubri]CDT79044.1 Binding-protein-dependent transport systems inner membrane component [Vibrio coralliirubri]